MTGFHDTPHALVSRFVAAFNQRDLSALDRLYEPAGVVVPVPGQVAPDRKGALHHLLSLRVPMSASVKRCVVAGDVALLVVEWAVGELVGTAADVVRRHEGMWRYVIDNPHGTV